MKSYAASFVSHLQACNSRARFRKTKFINKQALALALAQAGRQAKWTNEYAETKISINNRSSSFSNTSSSCISGRSSEKQKLAIGSCSNSSSDGDGGGFYFYDAQRMRACIYLHEWNYIYFESLNN